MAAGVLTKEQLRDLRLRRLLQDVCAPRHVLHDHALDCRGAALVLPPTARLTGRSLATVLGVRLRAAGDPVELVVEGGHRPAGPRGTLLRRTARPEAGGRRWRGVPVASSFRMGFDLAARHPPEDAVAHLDAVVGAGLLDRDAFRGWLTDRHDDDVVAVRAAAEQGDGRAQSHPESRLRVRLRRAGFDVVPQHEVRDAGGFVARVDLALVQLRVAVEHEGAWHGLLADQLAKDRRRLDRLREAGCVVVHVTADMMRQRGMVEDAVRRAVAGRLCG